jgi:hypothetical protein
MSQTNEQMEILRIRTSSMHPCHSAAIAKNMRVLYPYRVVESQTLSVKQEIDRYPHFKLPLIVSYTYADTES